jgi:hypothetical protein
MAQQFSHFDLLAVNDLFGEISPVIIGQFITFTTDVFPRRKQPAFYTPRGTAIISHSPQV